MLDHPPRQPPFPNEVAESPPCKCCGAGSAPFGVVDFHRSCEDQRQPPLPPSGIPIAYHRCPSCGFIFTVAFDAFTRDDFLAFVYNEAYVRVDPDFVDVRPRNNADLIAGRIIPGQPSLRLLDYGGGNGLLAELLRARGYAKAQSYDPFYDASVRPTGRFDVVSSFEVLEHSTTPLETLREMRSFVDDRGMVLFSTLLQPPEIASHGVSWWYLAPRNGHVSLYSRDAITALLKQLGLKWASFNENLHVAYRRKLPTFGRHLQSA